MILNCEGEKLREARDHMQMSSILCCCSVGEHKVFDTFVFVISLKSWERIKINTVRLNLRFGSLCGYDQFMKKKISCSIEIKKLYVFHPFASCDFSLPQILKGCSHANV
jgi:hypothetical protein